jgi:acetyl-CoA synthetase
VALPAPGVDLAVVDERGAPCPPAHGGVVALRRITPGMPLELQRQKPPLTVGVRARQDREGRLWTMGDVSLPRSDEDALALPEQEAVIAALPGVDGVAVVRYTDGAGVPRSKAFIKLQGGEQALEEIRRTLQRRFGARAVPDGFQVVAELPYSRTGKLLRSVLRRIASGELDGVEELSSLVDPALLRGLVGGTEPKA